MRRLWIPVAALVACVGLATQAGIAYARGDARRPAANTCASLVTKYQSFGKDISNADVSRPSTLSAAFKKLAADVNAFARTVPSQLRAAFKDLAKLYKRLASIDFSNRSNLSQLSSIARGGPYRADERKIADYLAKQCNYSTPTT